MRGKDACTPYRFLHFHYPGFASKNIGIALFYQISPNNIFFTLYSHKKLENNNRALWSGLQEKTITCFFALRSGGWRPLVHVAVIDASDCSSQIVHLQDEMWLENFKAATAF